MKNSYSKVRFGPFIHITPTISTISACTIIMLFPQLFMLHFYHDYAALVLIFLSVCACVLAETACNFFRSKHSLFNFTAVLEGLIVGMFLPSGYPPLQAFFIVLVTMLIVKQFFGGLAASWANPVVIAVIIAWFVGSMFFPPYQLNRSILSSSNPAAVLFDLQIIPTASVDTPVTVALNNALFKYFGMILPDGYVTLFWDTQSLIPAFRFNILTLASSLVLFAFNMLDMLIPACCLFVYALLVRLFGLTPFTGIVGQGDMLLAILTSGTLFCTFFVLPWHGTTPMSTVGKILYGMLAGFGSFLITGCGMSSVGAVFTVLVVNAFSPVIQMFEEKWYTVFKSVILRTRLEHER